MKSRRFLSFFPSHATDAQAIDAMLQNNNRHVAKNYLMRANILFTERKYQNALTHVEMAIALDLDQADAYFLRGHVRLVLREDALTEIIKDFDQAVALSDSDSRVYFECGKVLFQAGEFYAALKNFRQVLKLDPGNFVVSEYTKTIYKNNPELKREPRTNFILFPDGAMPKREDNHVILNDQTFSL